MTKNMTLAVFSVLMACGSAEAQARLDPYQVDHEAKRIAEALTAQAGKTWHGNHEAWLASLPYESCSRCGSPDRARSISVAGEAALQYLVAESKVDAYKESAEKAEHTYDQALKLSRVFGGNKDSGGLAASKYARDRADRRLALAQLRQQALRKILLAMGWASQVSGSEYLIYHLKDGKDFEVGGLR